MKIILQAAIEKMTMNPGNGDICSGPYEIGFEIDEGCKITVEGDPDRSFPFQAADFYGEKWEIIPAEPEVLTSYQIGKNMFDMNSQDVRTSKSFAISCAHAGYKSGRLAEYQRPEQVELRQSFKNLLNKAKTFMDNPACNDFTVCIQHAEMVTENLKPPTENTDQLHVFKTEKDARQFAKDHIEPAPESEKVLTAQRILLQPRPYMFLDDDSNKSLYSSDQMADVIQVCRENYRLERDQEWRKALPGDLSSHKMVDWILKNLKPLKAE